jgi:hypothetical protein
MNKYVWTIVAPYEAIPFRIIKPFHGSLHLSAPPDGDLDVSRSGPTRDQSSRAIENKLRGVYQNKAFSQESIRFFGFKKRSIIRV